jgi:hypothetical protein
VKRIIILTISLITTLSDLAIPRRTLAADPFIPDNTPNCSNAINKGAQKELDQFVLNQLIKDNENPPESAGARQIRDFFRQTTIRKKEFEMREFALRKYKCDLIIFNPYSGY